MRAVGAFSDHGANGGGWDITSRLESLRTTQCCTHCDSLGRSGCFLCLDNPTE